MRAYSMDLRERALLDSDAGMKAADVAAKYRVSGSWVRLLKQRRRETGEVAPRVQRHGRRGMLEPHLHTLAALIAAHPDRTLAELKDALATPASVPTVWRAVRALGLTVKKTVRPSEHDRPDVAAARVAWHAAAPTWDVAHLVCLDETGITTNLLRRYGRAPRGARVHDHAPCGRWQTSTFLAALRVTGLTAPGVFDGAIDGESFRAYIDQILVPTLLEDFRLAHAGRSASEGPDTRRDLLCHVLPKLLDTLAIQIKRGSTWKLDMRSRRCAPVEEPPQADRVGKPPGDRSFRLQALEVANNASIASVSRTELVLRLAEGRLAGVAFTHRHTHEHMGLGSTLTKVLSKNTRSRN